MRRKGRSPKHSGTPSVPGFKRAGFLAALGVERLPAGISKLPAAATPFCSAQNQAVSTVRS